MTRPARIFAIDDHPVVVEALRALVDASPDLVFAGSAMAASEALRALSETTADLVVLDLSLADGDGLDLLHRLHHLDPALRVLVFSMHPEDAMAELALRAGARGYLMKDAGMAELLRAIHTVLDGEVFVSEGVVQALLAHHQTVRKLDRLTARERTVFYLLGTEPHPARLAEQLHVSAKTVETHLRSIREKLDLPDLDALRAEAQRMLAPLPPGPHA